MIQFSSSEEFTNYLWNEMVKFIEIHFTLAAKRVYLAIGKEIIKIRNGLDSIGITDTLQRISEVQVIKDSVLQNNYNIRSSSLVYRLNPTLENYTKNFETLWGPDTKLTSRVKTVSKNVNIYLKQIKMNPGVVWFSIYAPKPTVRERIVNEQTLIKSYPIIFAPVYPRQPKELANYPMYTVGLDKFFRQAFPEKDSFVMDKSSVVSIVPIKSSGGVFRDGMDQLYGYITSLITSILSICKISGKSVTGTEMADLWNMLNNRSRDASYPRLNNIIKQAESVIPSII